MPPILFGPSVTFAHFSCTLSENHPVTQMYAGYEINSLHNTLTHQIFYFLIQTEEGFESGIIPLKNLEYLVLLPSPNLSDRVVGQFASLTNLKVLGLTFLNVTETTGPGPISFLSFNISLTSFYLIRLIIVDQSDRSGYWRAKRLY